MLDDWDVSRLAVESNEARMFSKVYRESATIHISVQQKRTESRLLYSLQKVAIKCFRSSIAM